MLSFLSSFSAARRPEGLADLDTDKFCQFGGVKRWIEFRRVASSDGAVKGDRSGYGCWFKNSGSHESWIRISVVFRLMRHDECSEWSCIAVVCLRLLIRSDKGLSMSTQSSQFLNSSGASRFHVSQAASSAGMVEAMIIDELRRGNFSQVNVRVERIEELVSENLLETECERKLLLLAAEMLEGSGETRRAYQITGKLLADRERLDESFLSALRRFRARLALNAGDIERARSEVTMTERVVMETLRGLGQVEHTIDGEDLSKVTAATWLLSAEISLAEREFEQALQDLANAQSCLCNGAKSVDESVMFELLSALVLVGNSDAAGAPALAYLYGLHVGLREESAIAAVTSARIAAASGDTGNVVGLSQSEVVRWRAYGPDPEAVKYYLIEGTSVPVLSDALAKLPQPSELLAALDATLASGRRGVVSQPLVESNVSKFSLLPMAFLFEFFRLEEVTGMFDYNLKTGHLVVDWSDCDEALLSEAVAAGAISELSLRCKSGTIYLNNGSYVDASLDSEDQALVGMSVQDVIFEIFRISTAGLPGAGARQFNGGPEVARLPERVNLRPNQFNLDLTKRLDHMRSGRTDEVEDPEVDLAFANWEPGASRTNVVDQGSVGEVDSPVVAGPVSSVPVVVPGVIGSLLGVFGAVDIGSLQLTVIECLVSLGLVGVRLEIELANSGELFRECGLSADLCEAWGSYTAGSLSMKVSFAKGVEVNCREAVDVVMRTAVERLRSLPGRRGGVVESEGFVAADPVTQALLGKLRELALLDGVSGSKQPLKHILLQGERGTGKELLARLIHSWSGRDGEKFSVAPLGVIRKELAASELFGHKKGAFTGADKDHVGYIQNAEKGTLFLDELDEAEDPLQAALKRVVQFRTYNVVGSPEEWNCNVRFVASTNRVTGVEEFIKPDLRDRFLTVRVPPLRERRGDIGPLAQSFSTKYRLPETVVGFLEAFDWPGNVRQLENVVTSVCDVVTSEEDVTLVAFEAAVQEEIANSATAEAEGGRFVPLKVGETYKDRMSDESRKIIQYYLAFTGGNRANTARLLGMARQTLNELIKAKGVAV
jgi:DNA-binding NtrC family response regulator